MMCKVKAWLQYILPQHALSRMVGRLANCRCRWAKNIMIRLFIKRYQINLSDYERTTPHEYKTFNDFFTRELKVHARSFPNDQRAIISPVDGVISQIGHIHEDQLIQAKGMHYSLEKLLGEDQYVNTFKNGSFATLYLSPRDYHRVHMPCDGELQMMKYIPGKLFSVNQDSALVVKELFARNERLITIFKTEYGLMSVVMVGAMIVAGINTVWSGKMLPNAKKIIQTQSNLNQPVTLARGKEMGHFELGSTVIIMFEPGKIDWHRAWAQEVAVKMGDELGLAK